MATGPIRDTEFPTIREAARRLACRPALIRAAIQAGELDAHPLGDRWIRVYWPGVVAWVRRKRIRPTEHARARVAEVLEREARSTGP